MIGFGGFPALAMPATRTHRRLAHWSGNGSTAASAPNRVSGAQAGALVQATAVDQPELVTLPNAVKALSFDGIASEMTIVPPSSLKRTGPALYWAFHLRCWSLSLSRTIWSEWGSTERFQVSCDASTVTVSVATSSIAFATSTFAAPTLTAAGGAFLEVLFDGNDPDPDRRVRVFIGLTELARTGGSLSMPRTLLPGNATQCWLGALNGASNQQFQVAHVYLCEGRPTAAERAALQAFEVPSWDPAITAPATSVPPITSWLAAAHATSDVDGISVLPDQLNSNPAVQSVTARKPTIETVNGVPCMRFTGNDVLRWPIVAANSNVQRFGVALWLKASSLAGINMLFSAYPGENGSSGARLRVYSQSTGLTAEIYNGPSGGRYTNLPGVLTTTDWSFVTFEYDALQAAEADKVTWTVNGSARSKNFGNQGAGGALGDLPAVTGNILLGNNNDGSASLPLEGLLGPNVFVLGAKASGAVRGLLTHTQRQLLMRFEPPM